MTAATQEFTAALDKIRKAETNDLLDASVADIKGIIAKLKHNVADDKGSINSSTEIDEIEDLTEYGNTYGNWVTELPTLLRQATKNSSLKKAKKCANNLVKLVTAHRKIEIETQGQLIKEILRAKSKAELERIKNGYSINHVKIPSMQERMQYIAQRQSNKRNYLLKKSEPSDLSAISKKVDYFYEKKRRLLRNKKLADILAFLLTLVISAGVGFLGGVAIMLILPAMGLPAFIPTFITFAIVAGFTEGLVYHQYNKRFCRGVIADGFFKKIEDFILNREAKKLKLKDRHDLTAKQKKRIIRQRPMEVKIKKASAIFALPLALLAGVGFSALIFTHIMAFMGLLGISSGVMLPAILAMVIGATYAAVMYSMFYTAIKKNFFSQIKDQIISLFTHKRWQELNKLQKFGHLLTCIIKLLGLALVLATAIAATVFTAGAWLNSSVAFFHAALGFTSMVANRIAVGIATVMFGTTFWFNVENSLQTVKTFAQLSWHNLSHNIVELIKHPSKLLSAVLNIVPFIIHIIASGAVAVQGASANPAQKIFAGSSAISSEFLVDCHAVIGHDEHDEEHHHDHNHDLVGTLWGWMKKLLAHCFPKKIDQEAISCAQQIKLTPSSYNNIIDRIIQSNNVEGTEVTAHSKITNQQVISVKHQLRPIFKRDTPIRPSLNRSHPASESHRNEAVNLLP